MLQINRVLHATDFSTSSRSAAKYALLLANRLHVPLDIVHVISGIGASTIFEYAPADLAADASESDRSISEGFESLRTLAQRSDVPVRFLSGRGPLPGPVILEEAKKATANLIVLGAHGGGEAEVDELGSVATDIVRRSTCPVMVIPAHVTEGAADERIERVVTFISFAHLLEPVVVFAAEFARLFEAHLDVLAATNGNAAGAETSSDAIERRLWHILEKNAASIGSGEPAQNGQRPYRDLQLHTMAGDSVDQILQFARDRKSDLLILEAPGLGSHESPFEQMAEEIVGRAPCPVILVNTCGRIFGKARSKPRSRTARQASIRTGPAT